jgi:hypothetical protein
MDLEDDAFSSGWNETRSVTESQGEIYLAPNTELTIKRSVPVGVTTSERSYYDSRRGKYVVTDPYGRVHYVDSPNDPIILKDEAILRARSGEAPSTIRMEERSSQRTTGQGVVIRRRR